MSTTEGGGKTTTDGLEFYIDAGNEKSYVAGATAWNDISQKRLVGTLTNGPTFSSSKIGSIVFDGIDDYVDFPVSPIVNDSYNNWTIDVWMKPGNQDSRFITPASNGVDQFLAYDNTNQRVNVQITESTDVNNRLRCGTIGSVPITIF